MKVILTKDNFWSKVKEDYPKAAELFLSFIDQYKIDNKWYQLFNGREGWDCRSLETELHPPKYHDLPIAMQLGIFMEFLHGYSVDYEAEDTIFLEEVTRIITDSLKEINDNL